MAELNQSWSCETVKKKVKIKIYREKESIREKNSKEHKEYVSET